jgi:hypothetical protein
VKLRNIKYTSNIISSRYSDSSSTILKNLKSVKVISNLGEFVSKKSCIRLYQYYGRYLTRISSHITKKYEIQRLTYLKFVSLNIEDNKAWALLRRLRHFSSLKLIYSPSYRNSSAKLPFLLRSKLLPAFSSYIKENKHLKKIFVSGFFNSAMIDLLKLFSRRFCALRNDIVYAIYFTGVAQFSEDHVKTIGMDIFSKIQEMSIELGSEGQKLMKWFVPNWTKYESLTHLSLALGAIESKCFQRLLNYEKITNLALKFFISDLEEFASGFVLPEKLSVLKLDISLAWDKYKTLPESKFENFFVGFRPLHGLKKFELIMKNTETGPNPGPEFLLPICRNLQSTCLRELNVNILTGNYKERENSPNCLDIGMWFKDSQHLLKTLVEVKIKVDMIKFEGINDLEQMSFPRLDYFRIEAKNIEGYAKFKRFLQYFKAATKGKESYQPVFLVIEDDDIELRNQSEFPNFLKALEIFTGHLHGTIQVSTYIKHAGKNEFAVDELKKYIEESNERLNVELLINGNEISGDRIYPLLDLAYRKPIFESIEYLIDDLEASITFGRRGYRPEELGNKDIEDLVRGGDSSDYESNSGKKMNRNHDLEKESEDEENSEKEE